MLRRIGLVLGIAVLALASVFALIGCGATTTTTTAPATTTTEAPKDIVDTAVAAGSFNTLVSLLTAAELVDTLRGPGPFTVFAPTDEAFAKVPKDVLDALGADPKGALTKVLTYHVIGDKVMAEAVADGLEVATVEGSTVKFTVKDGKAMINDATIVQTDIVCSNGVIHVIDAVILPPDVQITTTTTAAPTTTTAALKDIVDTAVAAGSFNTLASLLTAAELVDTLKGPGPFTVFAPTDEAFAKVPKDVLDALGADPKGALTKVLTYHVIGDKVMAEAVADGLEVATVEGSTVKFTVKDGKAMINDATIVQTDIVCSNGVIHVIDAVILPPGLHL